MSSVSIRSVTAGNWISKVLVTKLGMNNEIKPISHSPRARDYHGKRVVADGTISFRRKHREGTTIHDPVEFYVGRHFPDDMDMIFGRAYMTEKRLPRVNRSRMLPIFAHKKKDRAEVSEISEMEQAQRAAQQQGSQMIDVSRQSTMQQAQGQAGHTSGSTANQQPES